MSDSVGGGVLEHGSNGLWWDGEEGCARSIDSTITEEFETPIIEF